MVVKTNFNLNVLNSDLRAWWQIVFVAGVLHSCFPLHGARIHLALSDDFRFNFDAGSGVRIL